ncbi:hypothetical protein C8A03DRAFT_39212 [Achaetomium macrosporum]|uniref:Uncharacterized protein n=1 Tax=Achaetomium macrosporum TaxID=79813 RepID=A0AAN7C0K4_9PEZI|nr:hypothetical protein C8A03DRAFT_39212 [Achaetomium macrosporum]
MPRDASALRRLIKAMALPQKLQSAITKFHNQGMLPADRETGGQSVPIIARILEDQWVARLLSETGLDEARHRNIGWWRYQELGIAMPVVEDAAHHILERTSGPFGGVDRALREIETLVTDNPEKLLLPAATLHRTAVSILYRLAPAQEIETYYITSLLPAAVEEFLDNLAADDSQNIASALLRWLDNNPDGHLGSIEERAAVLFKIRDGRREQE